MAQDGEQPTESEAMHIEKMFLRSQYEAEHWDEEPESYREAVSLIVNSDLLDKHKVDFYDSRLVSFHIKDNHTAKLELEYDGKVMKLAFENVMEYEISSNASAEYVNTFHCYQDYDRPAIIVFTLDFVTVKALKVTLASVSAPK